MPTPAKKEYDRLRYLENRAKYLALSSANYLTNKTRKLAYQKKYAKENPERIRTLRRSANLNNRKSASDRKRLYRQSLSPEIIKNRDKTANMKRDRALSQACTHQAMVKNRYPEQYALRDVISSQDLRDWVVKHRGCPCPYCGQPSTSIDHKISLFKGGSHTWENLQLICKYCNSAKRDRTEEQFLAWIDALVALRFKTCQ